MSDLNYPDNLYADHLASQEPTGAYRAWAEVDPVEQALNAACIALRIAMDRLREAQAAYKASRANPPAEHTFTAKQAYDDQTRRDVAWSVQRGDFSLPKWHVDFGKPRRDDLPPNLAAAVKTPLEPTRIATPAELADLRQLLTAEELKGFGIGDVEPRHPMQAEALRQADEFERGDGETGL
jgi:hypothetical protein